MSYYDNENILTEALYKASEAVNKYTFKNITPIDKMHLYDEYLFSLPVDQTITHEINHTKFPDAIVLLLLESYGMYFDDIRKFESIECEPLNKPYSFGYNFNIRFAEPVPYISMELELKN